MLDEKPVAGFEFKGASGEVLGMGHKVDEVGQPFGLGGMDALTQPLADMAPKFAVGVGTEAAGQRSGEGLQAEHDVVRGVPAR